ncbi:MAG TPA: hypothetical protein VHV32_19410 [Candidatus Angelobacter sp.]|nr:hypothetical protein [Candidatus Angelobacter sp.]
MSTQQITWDDAAVKAAPQIKWDDEQPRDRVADSLENAKISPPETGWAASIDRFKNKVRDFMGADHKPAGDVMGGAVLGPLNAAHGAAIAPDHPARGAHEVISGIGQTVALPMAVANPGTMAYAAPAVAAQTGVTSGLKGLGVDEDYANLAGDAAGMYAGAKTLNPNAMKIPFRKIAQTGMAINEGIPVLNQFNKLAEAPGKIRKIWSKPEAPPVGAGTASGPVPSGEAPAEASPAPYRLSGKQIQDAKTVTPRQIIGPERQLTSGEAPVQAPAKPVARAEQPAVWPPERPSVIQPKQFRGHADSLEDKGIQEQMREDLENHGRSAFSQQKRDWFARNVPGSSKGDLVAKAKGEIGVERPVHTNGSGESPASQEAINRVSSEKSQGVQRFRIDTRSGKETPLIGVDAVDAKAGPYDRIIKRGPKGEEVVDEGPKARPPKQTPQVATNDNLESVLSRATKGLKHRSAKAGD